MAETTPSIFDQLRRLIAIKTPLVYVQTFEEGRLERALTHLAAKAFSQPVPLLCWSVTTGLRPADGEPLPGTADPMAAMDAVLAQSGAAVFLFYDLHRHYDDPRVVRRLRDVYRGLKRNYKTLFLCGPTLELPRECEKEVVIIDLPLPNVGEMDRIFEEVCTAAKKTSVDLGDQRDALLRGALGLTEDEASSAFTKLLLGKSSVGAEIVEQLYEEKRGIVRKEGILDYVPPRVRIEDIGGLKNLKLWLSQRQRFFLREAEDFGLDPPKGLLVTGISGCGKSMVVQAVSTYWRMPLIRLDMNRIHGAVAGTPERTLERAIHTAEAISPCVLWIDEIETAIVGTHGTEGSNLGTRIFSSFLTWMQEKTEMVFVAATANEIDKLPPELLRKGRFDEIFFVDLPGQQERMDILAVHLRRRGRDPEQFDLLSLAKSTNNFNGAELEQIVLSALYAAFDDKRELTDKDLYRALGRMVPLATTMAERIKDIKRWADTRAVKANT
jgi:ATP-dependent 26S proteasome regulatory subunit